MNWLIAIPKIIPGISIRKYNKKGMVRINTFLKILLCMNFLYCFNPNMFCKFIIKNEAAIDKTAANTSMVSKINAATVVVITNKVPT